jgi:hypothetical protein
MAALVANHLQLNTWPVAAQVFYSSSFFPSRQARLGDYGEESWIQGGGFYQTGIAW